MNLDLVQALTEPCTYIHCEDGWLHGKKEDYNRCWHCKGTGRVLSQAGEAFIEFLKQYGDFADVDHTHHIS